MSQPGLSEQIRNLEQQLGAHLFTRDRSGTRLTEQGQQLVPFGGGSGSGGERPGHGGPRNPRNPARGGPVGCGSVCSPTASASQPGSCCEHSTRHVPTWRSRSNNSASATRSGPSTFGRRRCHGHRSGHTNRQATSDHGRLRTHRRVDDPRQPARRAVRSGPTSATRAEASRNNRASSPPASRGPATPGRPAPAPGGNAGYMRSSAARNSASICASVLLPERILLGEILRQVHQGLSSEVPPVDQARSSR